MEYKVGETFDTLPESIARLSGGANRAVFLVEQLCRKIDCRAKQMGCIRYIR